jgi:hypothetical protein
MVIGFMGGIVDLCHRTKAILFERSSRDEKSSPLLDADAFLPFQGNEADSSASSALTAQDADEFLQSPFVTEFMPVDFEDFEFRDVTETGRQIGVCSDDPEQAARVARASAAGPAPNRTQLVNTAPVRDTVPDVCYALLRMRPLSISCAEGSVVISSGKVDYDKSGWRDDCVRISVRLSFIMPERLIDATSILHYELEAPPV